MSAALATVRVELPAHLRTLARIDGALALDVPTDAHGDVTPNAILEVLEARYPQLRGTIRDHGTLARRSFLRFFACQEDLSHQSQDAPLPRAVAEGREPFLVIGAIVGG